MTTHLLLRKRSDAWSSKCDRDHSLFHESYCWEIITGDTGGAGQKLPGEPQPNLQKASRHREQCVKYYQEAQKSEMLDGEASSSTINMSLPSKSVNTWQKFGHRRVVRSLRTISALGDAFKSAWKDSTERSVFS